MYLKSIIYGVKVLFALLVVLFLLYRHQLTNNFTFLLGDANGYDHTIQTSILEHWLNFFSGKSTWSEIGYFYPYERTIAQTDGYFLTGVIYLPFRYLGLDPYVSTELVGITLKVIGFLGALIMSRKVFKFNLNYSLIIAALFSLNNALTSHGYRIQLATVAFAPWLFLMHYETLKAFWKSKKTRFFIFGSSSMVFFGLWCITCFYISWFYAFYLTILVMTLIIVFKLRFHTLLEQMRGMKYQIIAVTFVSLFSIIPFVWAYFPKSRESGTLSYDKNSDATLTIENLFQLGDSNYFYTPLYTKILNFLSPNYEKDTWEYYNMGISVVIFALALSSFYVITKNRSRSFESRFIISILASVLISLILILQINNQSLWQIVFNVIPGAKALRVTNIFMLLLSIPLYVLAIWFVSKMDFRKLLIIPLFFVLLISELNRPLLDLDRLELTNMNVAVAQPLSNCKVFYVTGWTNQEKFYNLWEWINNQYAHNVSAMLISQIVNLPTINGMASYIPSDYDLVGQNGTAFSPNSDEYKLRVEKYIQKYHLNNVCELNLNTKVWKFIQ